VILNIVIVVSADDRPIRSVGRRDDREISQAAESGTAFGMRDGFSPRGPG
jgi:hypothetical protein